MLWLFLACAAIVGAYLARWIVRERETIRTYRDAIEDACTRTERHRED